MDLVRNIFAVVFGILGSIIILINWSAAIMYYINKEKHFSLVPLLGGGFLCIAFAMIPNNSCIYLCWIALFIDIGCLPAIIRALVYIAKRYRTLHIAFQISKKSKTVPDRLFAPA